MYMMMTIPSFLQKAVINLVNRVKILGLLVYPIGCKHAMRIKSIKFSHQSQELVDFTIHNESEVSTILPMNA